MATKITHWRPDTCGCVIDYEWDTDVPASDRQHTLSQIIPCAEHAARNPNNPSSQFNEAVENNARKNKVLAELIKIIPDLTQDQYAWSFTKDRILNVGFTDRTVNNATKTTIRAALNTAFPNKVIVL